MYGHKRTETIGDVEWSKYPGSEKAFRVLAVEGRMRGTELEDQHGVDSKTAQHLCAITVEAGADGYQLLLVAELSECGSLEYCLTAVGKEYVARKLDL